MENSIQSNGGASNYANKLIEIYKENLSFPYCSASGYYLLSGICPPDKFGSDCVGQAKILKQKLHDASICAKYIDDNETGRHRSLLCEIEGQLYYMTTYLMHPAPVPLNSGLLVVPSFPFVQGVSSSIFISIKGTILDVKKTWINSCRIDRFCFDINSANNEELSHEEWMRRLIHPEQKTISIRVMDIVNVEVLHYVMHVSKADRTHTSSSLGVSQKGSGEYNRTLRRIAELIGSSPSEIEEYIYGAYKIRKEMLGKV